MKKTILLGLALISLSTTSGLYGQTTAFVNVNVLPMDRERVLEQHTVLVRDGLIEAVAPSRRVQLPSDARIIEGDGLFLMPGLADMHVTLPSSQATEEQVGDFLYLLLANNVTVVRGMSGASNHLQIKRRVASGSLLGPTVYAGAPPLGGRNAQDPQGAIELMLARRSAGYDLLPFPVTFALPYGIPWQRRPIPGGIPSEGPFPRELASGAPFPAASPP
jgi:hypothetical protein